MIKAVRLNKAAAPVRWRRMLFIMLLMFRDFLSHEIIRQKRLEPSAYLLATPNALGLLKLPLRSLRAGAHRPDGNVTGTKKRGIEQIEDANAAGPLIMGWLSARFFLLPLPHSNMIAKSDMNCQRMPDTRSMLSISRSGHGLSSVVL